MKGYFKKLEGMRFETKKEERKSHQRQIKGLSQYAPPMNRRLLRRFKCHPRSRCLAFEQRHMLNQKWVVTPTGAWRSGVGSSFPSFEPRFESQWEWGLESLLLSCLWVLPCGIPVTPAVPYLLTRACRMFSGPWD